jgi:hypothetical protein
VRKKPSENRDFSIETCEIYIIILYNGYIMIYPANNGIIRGVPWPPRYAWDFGGRIQNGPIKSL